MSHAKFFTLRALELCENKIAQVNRHRAALNNKLFRVAAKARITYDKRSWLGKLLIERDTYVRSSVRIEAWNTKSYSRESDDLNKLLTMLQLTDYGTVWLDEQHCNLLRLTIEEVE